MSKFRDAVGNAVERFKNVRQEWADKHPDSEIRLTRILTWLKCALSAKGDDQKIIFGWVAFCAAYGEERRLRGAAQEERQLYHEYLRVVSRFDKHERLLPILLAELRGDIETLLNCPFTYQAYWSTIANRESEESHWEGRFERENAKMLKSLAKVEQGKRSPTVALGVVFDRIYVLRAHIFHGGAAHEDIYNRTQAAAVARILETLLPAFVMLMLAHPKHKWGPLMAPPQGVPDDETDRARPLREKPKKRQPL